MNACDQAEIINMKNRDDFHTDQKRLTSGDYRFRKMSEQDLDDVLTLERSAYEFPWSETIFKDCLRVNYHCYVVEYRQSTKGYAVMTVAAGESHILNLCLDPSLRGHGIGRNLLAHLTDDARRYRADTMLLEVRISNEIATSLYLNAGFNEIGQRSDYYPANNSRGREDALIFMLAL